MNKIYEKGVTRNLQAYSHTIAILMSMLRVWLEYGWSMARVWLKYASPTTRLRLTISMLLMLTLGSGNVWGQSPVEITTDTNGNGTIEDSEKKFYLIQTNAFSSFYIAPQDNNITTNNILGEYMLWYFLDAGSADDTQYYYIVNNSTGKYICHGGGTANTDASRGVTLVEKTSDNEERCKFYIELNETNNTTGFYNIDAKGKPSYFGLNKRNGSQTNQYPIRLTNDDNNHYINDTNSKWKFIAYNGTFTYPTPPFTPSTDSNKYYYEIHNVQKDTYYAATDATADKVIFTNQANESRAWYFKEAASDTWYKYYYIINPATGGEYMYYNGTADNTGNQTKAIDVKAYDSENEDRYQFVVVQAARGDGAGRVTCYAIIPKLLIDNLWTSSSLGFAQASITNGLNMGIINSRGATNGAHWEFKTTTFSTVCDHPVIAFDRTTGKASITTATLLPSIYYTTDGTEPSPSNGTLYSGPFTLTEQTTVKAIVTKEGYTDSEVTTLTIGKVATPTIQQETGTHNVSITTATPGATIYYTIDGTTPTTSSTLYEGASEELGGKPIKAIAVKDNMINSDIGEGEIDVRCATPAISFNNITSTVSITCGTEGSTIHYTIDNSEPTTTSTAYTGPFSVTSPTTVKAIATHGGLDPSVVAELIIPQVATPTIQNNGNNAVSITTATVGATIYYTTDGSTPTTSSTQYTVPLTENISGVTIKAIAVKEGMVTSVVGSDAVILQCTEPVIARSGNDGFTVSCSFPASGVTIYYTTDGSAPTTSSSSISSGGTVSCTLPVTVNAMAVATNYDNSDVSTATLKEGMDGDGTVGNPYTIKYQVDVEDFIDHVNTAEGASLHYKVIATAPLDFSSAAAVTQAFSGTFDGGTQPITGLTHPLFNTVDGGVVKNVTLQNVSISSSDEYVGAIAGIAQGYSRIYNCGILPNDATFPEGTHPTVSGGTCAGGIVGKLDGDSRVINCYSYADVSASTYAAGIVGQNTFASTAEVSDGKYTKLKTAVVNCMFYGNITGGSNQYGVYGGTLITNAAATGISSYNYYRSGSTFTTATGEPTAYNCSFPADERYLTQVEFHRSLLNSNRELCGWWVGSDVAPSTLTTTEVQAIPKDASIMYKWVVDPNLAPYPILKPFGKYPSIINTNTGTPWFDRTTAAPFEGKQLGTLSVIIKSGASVPDQHLFIPITDMDSLHYDFGYRKVQLPYYNTVFGNPDGATWQEKYAGNYTDQVVTGWKITNVSGGTQGSFVSDWQYGYNFADRNCTDKDLYSVSGRVFAQGGYYYVPDDVTEITIEAYWGKAIYVRNNGGYYDRVNVTSGNTGAAFAPTGTRDNNVNGATIQTTSIKETLTADNIDAKKTVYDYALVLVGNVQESVGKSDVVHKTQDTRGFTIMSVDLDFDEEPDYCLEWQLGKEMTRQVIAPIRFDFLPVVELGIAGKLHNSKDFYSLGCYRSKGHFEVTETAFIRFGQFEFELGTRDDGPIILNGGIYDQYSRGRNGETNQHINYVILGGHIVMPSFTPGAHVNSAAKYQTRHCAVNVLGGDFTSFYLTGGYNEAIVPYEDNPHCYIDGGRFGTIAAAYKEGIWGDVTWRINHALIGEFYGGGVMAQATGDTYKIVKGSIDVVINNSIVGKYCGGPKFGDMISGKTVKTSATGTTFNQFFGAGNGGTNYVQYANTDGTGVPVTDWSSTINTNYTPGKYRNKDQGYAANYDLEVINYSTGDGNGKFVNRSYYYSAQFATTNTGNVTSTLTDCTINTNFYGGGFLGGVTGNVTSTLNNCNVTGSVFGAGYSASAGTVSISNKDKNAPVVNTYTGMIKPQSGGTSTTYYWTHDKGSTSSPITAATETDPNNYFYTEIPLDNLGSVSGNVTITINGTTSVGESVYGGGEESVVNGNTTVTVTSGTIGTPGKGGARWGNVFGGGKGKEKNVTAGLVKGNTTINISQAENQTTTIIHNVYGGGAYGSVGDFTYDGTTGMPTALATANTGACTINITGGTLGSDGKENGMVFGSSRGDVATPEGEPAVDPNDRMAWVYSTHVTIGDAGAATSPTIRGSVYGSGENGHTFQNTVVDINKGKIGITDTSVDGGATYAYRGNVYGGGCGTDKYDSNGDGIKDKYNPLAGIVQGTATVNITGGHVVHNVYGAGAMGSVGGGAEATSGKTTINVTGGRIGYDGDGNGHVFGAARGEYGVSTAASGLANVSETSVNINYATTPAADNADKNVQLIAGTVFGGGEAGTVKGSVAVNMTGGLILKDVYGGGALADTQTDNWDATANENAGGWADAEKKSALHTTTVRLIGGRVGEEVFGGGLGEAGKPAYVWGDVLIDLNGTTSSGTTGTPIADDAKGCVVGQVFGCNNINGTPKGTVTVHVYATQSPDKDNISTKPAKGTETFDVEAVYGGGSLAAYEPEGGKNTNKSTKVIIDGCGLTSIRQVYGGGNAASTPATNVEVNGTYEILELFGGGNGLDNLPDGRPNPGANVGYKNYTVYEKDGEDKWIAKDDPAYDTKEERTAGASAIVYGTGQASVNVFGGTIHRVFGGSNTKGNVRKSAVTLLDENSGCDFCVDEAYGGGKSAPMDAEAKLLMACIPGLKAAYGGAEAADIQGDVVLNITNGTFDRIFGGNNESGTIRGSIVVNIEETGCRPLIIGELYGGGNLAGYSKYGYKKVDDVWVPREAKDGQEPGTVLAADPQVNVRSFTSIGNIYGGGYGETAVMVGNPHVNINVTEGKYAANGYEGTEKTIDGHQVIIPPHVEGKIGAIQNVYGGGYGAKVDGDTYVNIGTQVGESIVFNTPFTKTVNNIEVNTTSEDRTHEVKGVDIRGSIYGGGYGSTAVVTGNTNVQIGK
ncbi:chitobiase/beta-hexosaminidase C-terminal domain-containing protein [uncultured Prevotella sp.]|uniref:chitobiase/beta-hexosaminidase C-terminal domain-containing protein n=1 Tax=uncultured Prevotella sp. TaxID=159272 RepID=UPI00258B2633|nr:chitobiase/beta-hexosaminidase C-terminal domain-containing protein [uncultured Prevotella sp.]